MFYLKLLVLLIQTICFQLQCYHLFLFVIWSAKEGANGRKFVSKWHPTTKGTLRRNYRVPSKSEGRRLLKAIASLLSDDDHFVDATSHKVLHFSLAWHKVVFPLRVSIGMGIKWEEIFHGIGLYVLHKPISWKIFPNFSPYTKLTWEFVFTLSMI